MPELNKLLEFSIEGFILRRSNPDGTPTTTSRVLGFSGTVDLSVHTPTFIVELAVKVDSTEEIKDIDFSGAIDKTAVTVAEMVTSINNAAFTDITASADSITGRLLIVHDTPASVKYLQVYDGSTPGFAASLDFGQGIKYGGQGVRIVKAFDNVISVSLPINQKDKEEIETEAGDGTYSSIIIEAITKGRNPVLTMNDKDFYIKQLILGGVYDIVNNRYRPPTTAQTRKPIFVTEIFVATYPKGTSNREDIAGYNQTILFSCTGNEGDGNKETKVIANFVFNLSSTEHNDENGNRVSYEEEANLTPEEYEALDIENL